MPNLPAHDPRPGDDERLIARLEQRPTDDLSIVELFDLSHARDRVALAKRRRLEAELAILDLFDDVRHRLGHDYGGGQRARELGRRRYELQRLGARSDFGGALAELEPVDLSAAWARVGAPRVARLERRAEGYRRRTTSTAKTVRAWELVKAELDKRVAGIGYAR